MKGFLDNRFRRWPWVIGGLGAGAWLFWWGWPESGAGSAGLGVAMLGLGFYRPAWALALLALTAPFESSRDVAFWGTVYTTEMGLAALLPGALWNLRQHPGWQRPLAPVARWGMAFVLVLAVSAGFSGYLSAWRGAVKWLEFGLAAGLGVHLLRRGEDAEWVLWALVLAAAISAFWGLAQTAGPASNGWPVIRLGGQSVTRAAGGFGANTLALFLALVLPWVLAAAWQHPRALTRGISAALAGLLVAGCVATFSLTGWLALGSSAGWLFLIGLGKKSTRWLGVVAVLIILSGAVAVWILPQSAPGSFWLLKWFSLSDRLGYAETVGRMLAVHPWLGVGPGEYRLAAAGFSPGGINPIGLITHPHSLYLTILAELGFFGLAALMLALAQTAGFINRSLPRLRQPWPRAAGWALAASLVGWLVGNVTDHALVHDRGVHAALWLSAVLVWVRKPARASRAERLKIFEAQWASLPTPDWRVAFTQRSRGRAPYLALLRRSLAGRPAASILELGCGPALDAIRLARRPSLDVHALDCSQQAVSLARQAAAALGQKLTVHQGDARRTGWPDARFDLIFSQGLWEHFPDVQPVWAESVRLLKPGGCLVVDVPQTWNPYTAIKLWHRLKGDWPWGWETQYTVGALRREGQSHGLVVKAVRGYGYPGGPADLTGWCKKWLGQKRSGLWRQLERKTGQFWMMNVAVLFQKPVQESSR